MKPRDKLLQALELSQLEVPPATTFGSGIWTVNLHGLNFNHILGKPEEYSRVVLKTQKITGWDLIFMGSGMNNFVAEALGAEVSVGGNIQIRRNLRAEDLSSAELSENTGIKTIWEATKLVYDNTSAGVAVTSWGPFTLASNLLGMENFLIHLINSRSTAKRAVEISSNAIKEFYLPLIEEKSLDIVSIAEPASSGDVISPEHFREFSKPYLEELVTFFRKRGVKVLLHICGKNNDRLEDIAEIGADCFSPGETTDLGKVKEIVGKNSCIAGNVAPLVLLQNRETVEKEAMENIRIGFSDSRGYMLSTGCDLAPATPMENVVAFLGMTRKYA